MKACLRFAPMLSARPGELSEPETLALGEHLAGCEACQGRLADATALEGMVGQALMAEANARDFSSFVDGVMERVGAEDPTGLLVRAARFFRRHRALAVGTAFAPLAALALIVYLARDGGPNAGDVEILAVGRGTMVLETREGPVILLGEPSEPEGS